MASRHALLTVALMLASACSTTWYEGLPLEADLPDQLHMAETAALLPNHKGLVTVGEAAGKPVRVWYRHTRGGTGEWLVVMLSGALSDSSALRYVAGGLGDKHNLLLIDYMGCGQSDKPDPKDLPPDAYGPTALARQVLLVIRKRARDERIAVVGHSLGAMVILRMLGDPGLRREFPEEIAKIERAVLLAPVDFAIAKIPQAFKSVVELSAVEAKLAAQFGIMRSLVARSFYEGAGDRSRMPREEVDSTVRVLSDLGTLRAAQEMLLRAVPLTEGGSLDWERIREFVAQYRNVEAPCLLVSGERDSTFSCAMSYKLRAQLPRAWLHVIPNCGHSLNLERPREVAALIDGFIAHAGADRPLVLDGVVAGYPAHTESTSGHFLRRSR